MNRWKQAGIFLILFSLFVGCGDSSGEPVAVSEEQDGESITLEQGQLMTLILPGNPSTGYEWKVPQEIQATLTLHDSSYTPDSDRIGAPGHYTFNFKAQQVGTVNLHMAYARGWETEEPANTFSLTVIIVHRSSDNSDSTENLGESKKPTDPYAGIEEPGKATNPDSTVTEPEKATDSYPAIPGSE